MPWAKDIRPVPYGQHGNPNYQLDRQKRFYRSAKHSLIAKRISSMLMFFVLPNPCLGSSSRRPSETSGGLWLPGLRSNRKCRISIHLVCRTVLLVSRWIRQKIQPPIIGIAHGGELAHSPKILRRDRLLGERHSHEVQGWCMDRGPGLEKGPRRQKLD